MTFVLDASVTLAWHFEDERNDQCDVLALRAARTGVVVPPFWELETANGLIRGERMRRTNTVKVDRFIEQLSGLPLVIDEFDRWAGFDSALPLARLNNLRIFDAGYLAIAMRYRIPLATLDIDLAKAAVANEVELLGAAL